MEMRIQLRFFFRSLFRHDDDENERRDVEGGAGRDEMR
jgi:hypothetical protein